MVGDTKACRAEAGLVLAGVRVAVTVFTTYPGHAARNLGQPRNTNHVGRYPIDTEYLEVGYKLKDGSW
ncbi:hypothetical protein CF640_37875 [Burkholderia pseudomallei]|nr:hypothetical protein CF640_37875 [Burkholderia pseudomallei]